MLVFDLQNPTARYIWPFINLITSYLSLSRSFTISFTIGISKITTHFHSRTAHLLFVLFYCAVRTIALQCFLRETFKIIAENLWTELYAVHVTV